MRIANADYGKHGYSKNCLGCRSSQAELDSRPHTEACRQRMEKAIGQEHAGKVRVEKARQRHIEMMADNFAQESKDAKEEDVEETTLQEQGEHDVMDQRQSQHDEHGAPQQRLMS